MKYCSNCGHQLETNAKFCGNCGVAVSDSIANNTSPSTHPPLGNSMPTSANENFSDMVVNSFKNTVNQVKAHNIQVIMLLSIAVMLFFVSVVAFFMNNNSGYLYSGSTYKATGSVNSSYGTAGTIADALVTLHDLAQFISIGLFIVGILLTILAASMSNKCVKNSGGGK